MKTTLEIPDALFRRVKSNSAERGQSLKAFVSEALQEKLAHPGARLTRASRSGCRASGSSAGCAKRSSVILDTNASGSRA